MKRAALLLRMLINGLDRGEDGSQPDPGVYRRSLNRVLYFAIGASH
jgi:hypothetical protein